jgi:hypothetical protein
VYGIGVKKKGSKRKIGLDRNEGRKGRKGRERKERKERKGRKERKEGKEGKEGRKEGKTKGTNVARKDAKDHGQKSCQRISGRISDWFQKPRQDTGQSVYNTRKKVR